MSERMTCINLIGGPGIADYGRRTVAEMLVAVRQYALHQKAEAERILAATDDDFHVETYVGVHVQNKREVIQQGKPRA